MSEILDDLFGPSVRELRELRDRVVAVVRRTVVVFRMWRATQ